MASVFTLHVQQDSSGLGDDQRAGGQVPDVHPDLVVSLDAAGRHQTHVHGRGSGATHAADTHVALELRRVGGGIAGSAGLPVDGDAEDVPQAREDLVHDFGVSVGSELGGDDRPLDVFKEKKHKFSSINEFCGEQKKGHSVKLDVLISLTFLIGNLQRLSVTERTPPPPRREHLVFEATVDDAELHLKEGGERHVTGVSQRHTPMETKRCELTCLVTENPMETATNGNLSEGCGEDLASSIRHAGPVNLLQVGVCVMVD